MAEGHNAGMVLTDAERAAALFDVHEALCEAGMPAAETARYLFSTMRMSADDIIEGFNNSVHGAGYEEQPGGEAL